MIERESAVQSMFPAGCAVYPMHQRRSIAGVGEKPLLPNASDCVLVLTSFPIDRTGRAAVLRAPESILDDLPCTSAPATPSGCGFLFSCWFLKRSWIADMSPLYMSKESFGSFSSGKLRQSYSLSASRPWSRVSVRARRKIFVAENLVLHLGVRNVFDTWEEGKMRSLGRWLS